MNDALMDSDADQWLGWIIRNDHSKSCSDAVASADIFILASFDCGKTILDDAFNVERLATDQIWVGTIVRNDYEGVVMNVFNANMERMLAEEVDDGMWMTD